MRNTHVLIGRNVLLAAMATTLSALASFAPAQDTPVAGGLDPATARKVRVLTLIWKDAESKPAGSPERKQYLVEYMTKSRELLRELPPDSPAAPGAWLLRALGALELDQPRNAWEAGQQMIGHGLDKSSNELHQNAFAMLERKGLLGTSVEPARRFAEQDRTYREALKLANPQDALRAEELLVSLPIGPAGPTSQPSDVAEAAFPEAAELLERIRPWADAARARAAAADAARQRAVANAAFEARSRELAPIRARYARFNAGKIAAGTAHVVAVRNDGTVAAWGACANPPNGLVGVVAVAAGDSHSLALRRDGTVVAWGQTAAPPDGLRDVIAIAAGGTRSYALRRDGTVASWGQGSVPVPDRMVGIVAIAAHPREHYPDLALRADGTVSILRYGILEKPESYTISGEDTVAFSTNAQYLMCSNGAVRPVRFGFTNDQLNGVVSLVWGLALRPDGTVTKFEGSDVMNRKMPRRLTDVVAVASGADFSVAVKSDGSVIAWGINDKKQLDVPRGLKVDLPK